ncbi:MAG: hypothetical protein NTX75_04815 [Proteobacteria bacterium]|nr:hypothetical protein [Pseudomonadota bacterium]
MKLRMLVVLVVILGLSFILPTASFAWSGSVGGGAGYRGGWGPYRPYGWYRPRVYVGAAFVNPWYVPTPVYAYSPVVVYTNPAPPPAYAYPDPRLTGQYTGENPPGEWITVPGQWVDGKWIPSHSTWVSVNP